MAEEVGDGEEKKSSKKMVIIIAAIVILLLAGGAGYYFMMDDSAAVDAETAEVQEEDEAVEEFYYDLPKPLVVNFSKGSSARLIQVSVSLLVAGEDAVKAMTKHEPMIRNNLLMIISAKNSDDLSISEGKQVLRAEMLKEIGSIMEKMMGKNQVNNLFFTTFVMQ